MSALDRAAQFAPFAALTGYDDVIRETGRQTDSRIELDETLASQLDERLATLLERLAERPFVKLTVFQKDARKQGGRYITIEGNIRDIDLLERRLVLVDGTIVPLVDLTDIRL